MRNSFFAAVALALAATSLAGCAAGLPAKVTRYSALPAPAGQTFQIVPGDGAEAGLQFASFAGIVAQQMQARGYVPAAPGQAADMIVRLGYTVDEGRTELAADPFARSRYYGHYFGGIRDPFLPVYYGRPYFSRYGYYGARSPFYWGWDDPFWYHSPYAGYGPGYRGAIREYRVYESALELDIHRSADNQPLFEGDAKARSQTDELGILVPNLIEAMFTGFPGRSGETIRITVPARKRS